jgi:hypothetical protein
MKLWIDDLRPPPDAEWTWARTSAEALAHIKRGITTEISFDYDLGGDDTALPVAQWIERCAHDRTMEPVRWQVHSANPVGRANLEACIRSAERFWARWHEL